MNRLVVSIVITLAALITSQALAQAHSTPRPVDPDLVLSLLGAANSIAIEVPEAARHLYVAAVQHGEAVLTTDVALTERRGGVLTATVAAGALADANACPVLLFVSTALEGDLGRFSSSTASRCLDRAAGPVRRAAIGSPLATLPAPRELGLDDWIALVAARLHSEAPADGDDFSGLVVFYLHLSTDEAGEPPEPPAFTTAEEFLREQSGRPSD